MADRVRGSLRRNVGFGERFEKMRTLPELEAAYGMRRVDADGPEVSDLLHTLHARGWSIRRAHGHWTARRTVATASGLTQASENTPNHVKVANE